MDERPRRVTSAWPPLTLAEAAVYLHRSEHAVYQLVHRGYLPHSKPCGGKLYFRREDLDDYAFSGYVPSDAQVAAQAESIILDNAARKRGKGK